MSRSVDERNVKILAEKPLEELKRLQNLIRSQIEKAGRDRSENAEELEELRVKQDEVIEAIIKKEFSNG